MLVDIGMLHGNGYIVIGTGLHSFSTNILSVSEVRIANHHPGDSSAILKAVHTCPYHYVPGWRVFQVQNSGDKLGKMDCTNTLDNDG